MDTSIVIGYKINKNWIIVNDLKNIPSKIKGLKINNYTFEDFEEIGCIIEVQSTFSNTNYIVWIIVKENRKLSLYKLYNNELIKIPLFNFERNA